MYDFDLDKADVTYIDFEEVKGDPKHAQNFHLITLGDDGFVTTSFWGEILNAEELQKDKPTKFKIPPRSVRNKIFAGCRVKIGVVDPVSSKCKLTWVTLISRSDTPDGPVFSAFFNHSDDELDIAIFSFIPFLLPINFFAVDLADFLFQTITESSENIDRFHQKQLMYNIDFFKEFKKIPKSKLPKLLKLPT